MRGVDIAMAIGPVMRKWNPDRHKIRQRAFD